MNHPRDEDLSAYVDGGLTPEASRAIVDHLASCPSCSAEVGAWESMRALIRSTPAVEPEPWFAERMESMVMGEEAEVERWAGPERVAARAVLGLAMIVLAMAVSLLFRPEGPAPSVDRALAVGSGDTTLMLASTELTRDNLLEATIAGE